MKTTILVLALVAITVGAGNVFGAEGDKMLYAGTAKVEITPSREKTRDLLGKELTLRDKLYARALVLKSDETSVAIVSLDLILFSSAKVVAQAKEQWKVDHVILCSTHTHSGMSPKGLVIGGGQKDWTRGDDPARQVDWPALSSDPWYAATEDKIVTAIGAASKNLFPATVVAGIGPYENAYMAHNRRLVRPDGSVQAMWDNPNRLPTEPIDPTMGILQVNDAEGKPRALLVNYACHPVASANSGYLHRDYPGSTVDYIEEQLGDQCMAMFTQGAEGDQDPYDMARNEHGFNILKQAGISLGKRVVLLSNSLNTAQGVEPSIKVKQTTLKLAARHGNAVSDVVLTTIVINDSAAFVTVPGEPFVQHQLDLRAKSPLPATFMMGLAYSGAGTPFTVYIPTAKAVSEGGYGATECSFLEPNAGEKIVNEGVASIKELLAR